MKNIRKFNLVFAAVLLTAVACQDESLIEKNLPTWETAINTYASRQTGSAADFVNGNAAVDIKLNWRWISADGKNVATKVEFYILFDEKYVDKEGNDKVVRHGGSAGKLFKTLEGAAIGASRADVGFAVTQADIYNVYKDAKYNYCGAEVPVFVNPDLKPGRTPSNPFVAGDSFILKWTVFLEDGRKVDSWSPSVCNEVPGSNCQFGWGVVCQSNLAGTYSYSTTNIFTNGFGTDGPGPVTGTGTMTSLSTGSYSFDIPGTPGTGDVSFGMYGFAYGGGVSDKITLSDACAFISFKGVDSSSTSWTAKVTGVTDTQLTLDMVSNYGEKFTTVLTRTDSKTWPLNLTTVASGSCN